MSPTAICISNADDSTSDIARLAIEVRCTRGVKAREVLRLSRLSVVDMKCPAGLLSMTAGSREGGTSSRDRAFDIPWAKSCKWG